MSKHAAQSRGPDPAWNRPQAPQRAPSLCSGIRESLEPVGSRRKAPAPQTRTETDPRPRPLHLSPPSFPDQRPCMSTQGVERREPPAWSESQGLWGGGRWHGPSRGSLGESEGRNVSQTF